MPLVFYRSVWQIHCLASRPNHCWTRCCRAMTFNKSISRQKRWENRRKAALNSRHIRVRSGLFFDFQKRMVCPPIEWFWDREKWRHVGVVVKIRRSSNNANHIYETCADTGTCRINVVFKSTHDVPDSTYATCRELSTTHDIVPTKKSNQK